jgi:hypothetical protein
MKRVAALTIVSFAAFAVGLALISSAYAQVTGRTFRVTVKTNFGTTFTDCYRFDFPNPGDLTIDQTGQVLTYRHGQLDTVDTRFKAVSLADQPSSFMFFGEELEALEQLTGEGVTGLGNTSVFSGPETGPSTSPSLCVPSVGTSGEYYDLK